MFADNLTLHSIFLTNMTGHGFYFKMNVPGFIFFFTVLVHPITASTEASVVLIYIAINVFISQVFSV